MGSNWMSIETAPKDGTSVLLKNEYGAIFSAHWAEWISGEFYAGGNCWAADLTSWMDYGNPQKLDFSDKDIAGWMPLP